MVDIELPPMHTDRNLLPLLLTALVPKCPSMWRSTDSSAVGGGERGGRFHCTNMTWSLKSMLWDSQGNSCSLSAWGSRTYWGTTMEGSDRLVVGYRSVSATSSDYPLTNSQDFLWWGLPSQLSLWSKEVRFRVRLKLGWRGIQNVGPKCLPSKQFDY